MEIILHWKKMKRNEKSVKNKREREGKRNTNLWWRWIERSENERWVLSRVLMLWSEILSPSVRCVYNIYIYTKNGEIVEMLRMWKQEERGSDLRD